MGNIHFSYTSECIWYKIDGNGSVKANILSCLRTNSIFGYKQTVFISSLMHTYTFAIHTPCWIMPYYYQFPSPAIIQMSSCLLSKKCLSASLTQCYSTTIYSSTQRPFSISAIRKQMKEYKKLEIGEGPSHECVLGEILTYVKNWHDASSCIYLCS